MLEMQKRERTAIADRFRQHFDAARDSLRSCLDTLPSDLRLDPEIANAVEQAIRHGEGSDDELADTGCSQLLRKKDELMCSLTDC